MVIVNPCGADCHKIESQPRFTVWGEATKVPLEESAGSSKILSSTEPPAGRIVEVHVPSEEIGFNAGAGLSEATTDSWLASGALALWGF